MSLVTQRLLLRPWQDADRQPFADLSADPEVMRFLLPIDGRAATDVWIDRQMAHLAEHGFCFWAVAERDSGAFVGAIGLLHVSYQAHFTPAVEVGWRVARRFWGRGYAPEGATASLRFAFEVRGLEEIVANTAPANANSRRVMQKLNMIRDPADDYDHPRMPSGHPLQRQVLYRMRKSDWLNSTW